MEWAATAPVGKRVTYALRHDAERCVDHKHALSMASAQKAHEAGLVFIAQRRAWGKMLYECTRISRPTALILKLVEPGR